MTATDTVHALQAQWTDLPIITGTKGLTGYVSLLINTSMGQRRQKMPYLSMLSAGAEQLRLLLKLLCMLRRVSFQYVTLQVTRGAHQLALQLRHMARQLAMPVKCCLLFLHVNITFSTRENSLRSVSKGIIQDCHGHLHVGILQVIRLEFVRSLTFQESSCFRGRFEQSQHLHRFGSTARRVWHNAAGRCIARSGGRVALRLVAQPYVCEQQSTMCCLRFARS